jgi:hypothetical protein
MLEFAKKLYDELLLELKNQDETHGQNALPPDYRLALIQASMLTAVMNPFFNAIYSNKIANMLAYIRLDHEILQSFLPKKNEQPSCPPNECKLEWTDSKAALTELVYALNEQGAFNHGHASIKEITAGIQSAFSVDLGNTSSCFQEILSRKSGYTIYLDKLKDKLNSRIDHIEARNNY